MTMTLKEALKQLGCEPLSDRELEEQYSNMLDDCYPEVEICGYTYEPSRALKDIDPIAYDCGFADYISSQIGDYLEEVDCEYYTVEQCDEARELIESEEEE